MKTVVDQNRGEFPGACRSLRKLSIRVMLALIVAFSGRADVIDRVAVAVGNSAITESEILRQIRITALLNGEKPDFSAGNKRDTADRLVEQALIRRDIAISRYTPAGATRSKELYEQFESRFRSGEARIQTLAEYGVTVEDLKNAFDWQATLLDFIDVRFRPGVQIPESEVKSYYETELKQKITPGSTAPTLEEAREQIEQILTQRLVDNALDRWLGQARTQTRIRYKEEVFR